VRLDYNLPCFSTLALPPAPTVKRKLRYLKSQQQFLDLLRTCQNFLLKLFRPVNHTQRLRPCLLLCIHTLHSFGRVSSSLTVSPSETRSPTRDAAEPCHVLTSRDELGRSIIKAPSYPCGHAGRGSIVTDLYQFRLHIYNCKRLKYRSPLQNLFSFAASCFSHVHFSFLPVVCDCYFLILVFSSCNILYHDGVLGPPDSPRLFLFSSI
jgi:hypothetical protein